MGAVYLCLSPLYQCVIIQSIMKPLIPLQGNILVEIREAFDNVVYVDEKYDTKTQGLCVAVGDKDLEHLIGKRVFWRKYEDGEHIFIDNSAFAFIETKALQGYEDEQTK